MGCDIWRTAKHHDEHAQYTAQVRTFDISEARQRLGYEPRVSMEKGIRRAVEWHLSSSAKAKISV
jgi:sterol-4alpha-carboxylate 3-dehydrogenase (decarboxylating)